MSEKKSIYFSEVGIMGNSIFLCLMFKHKNGHMAVIKFQKEFYLWSQSIFTLDAYKNELSNQRSAKENNNWLKVSGKIFQFTL